MDLKKLQDRYYHWIPKQYKITTTMGYNNKKIPTIVTPFKNTVGDLMNIYVTNESHDGKFITLDDDGETINNFRSLDTNPLKTSRKPHVHFILNTYNVKLVKGDTLSISGKASNFPKMEYELSSAMKQLNMLINNMYDPFGLKND